MNQYAIDRKAFGQPINRFGQIQHLIADSYAAYQAGRSFLYNVSNNIDLLWVREGDVRGRTRRTRRTSRRTWREMDLIRFSVFALLNSLVVNSVSNKDRKGQ